MLLPNVNTFANMADNKYFHFYSSFVSKTPKDSHLVHLSEVGILSVLQVASGEEQLLVQSASPLQCES